MTQELKGSIKTDDKKILLQMFHKDTVVLLAAAQINPTSNEFDDMYDKTYNKLIKLFRNKKKQFDNKQSDTTPLTIKRIENENSAIKIAKPQQMTHTQKIVAMAEKETQQEEIVEEDVFI